MWLHPTPYTNQLLIILEDRIPKNDINTVTLGPQVQIQPRSVTPNQV